MKAAIIGAMTGNGHVSVMNTLKKEFDNRHISIDCYPDFYESLQLSNKILSDFYNFLIANSIPLCNKYCEFTSITRYDVSENFYEGVKEKIKDFLLKNKYDVLISVAHTINPVIIRIINELEFEEQIKFVIVVTDPFEPIAVGYAVPGAYRYYCSTEIVKNYLIKRRVDESKIRVYGYPINLKFQANGKEKTKKKNILLNAGSQGITYYYDFLRKIANEITDMNIVMICGKNQALYHQANRFVNKNELGNRITIYSFVNNLEELLNGATITITKPGANTFFEAISCKIPIIIDATEGFIYQEKGVQKYMEKYKVGEILYDKDNLVKLIQEIMNDSKYNRYIDAINDIPNLNGTIDIVDDILKLA